MVECGDDVRLCVCVCVCGSDCCNTLFVHTRRYAKVGKEWRIVGKKGREWGIVEKKGREREWGIVGKKGREWG